MIFKSTMGRFIKSLLYAFRKTNVEFEFFKSGIFRIKCNILKDVKKIK